MKSRLLSILALLAAFNGSRAETDAPPSGPKLVQSYKDVLAVIPDEFSPARASQWTELKKSAVNVILKENIVDPHTRAKFHATVSQVAHWPDLTLFWEVPNSEGYHIRVFAHFTDDWKARLSMLNTGDPVTIEGTFFEAKFRDLWGNSTLSLCLGGSTFTKEATATGQTQVAPAVRKTAIDTADATPLAEPRMRGSFDSAALNIKSRSLLDATAAQLSMDWNRGIITFTNPTDLSHTTSFQMLRDDLRVLDLLASVKDAPTTYGLNSAIDGYQAVMLDGAFFGKSSGGGSTTLSGSVMIQSWPVQSSAPSFPANLRATFELTENSVRFVLLKENSSASLTPANP